MTDMQQLALEEAALKTLADAVNDRLKDVRADMQTALEDGGISRIDATLPNGTKVATISRSDPKPTAQVIDEKAFLEFVRRFSPHNVTTRLVTEVRPAYTAALLAEMTAAGIAEVADKDTGVVEPVPGVEIKATRGKTHSVRHAKGGAAAIAAAWRDGHLAHLNIPQLTAAPEEAS